MFRRIETEDKSIVESLILLIEWLSDKLFIKSDNLPKMEWQKYSNIWALDF